MKHITQSIAIIPIALLCATATAQPADFPDSPPVSPPLDPTPLPPVFSQKLDNGMEVICVTSHEIPWVSVSWYLLAGAKFDPDSKAGTATATADLLRQGTAQHDTDALAELLDFHAIDLGGSAGHETTSIYTGSLDRYVDLAVKTLAEVVRTPTFPKREFSRHMAQKMDGLRIAEADGSYWARREIERRIYGRHYMARPSRGTSQSLPNITRDDLIAFHKTHYMPNNALLVFSGDILSSQAMELANKYFGDWPTGTPAVCQTPDPPQPAETRIYLVDRPGSTQSQIRIGQLGFKRTDPQYIPSQVFNQVFGGSFNSRLNSVVRVEEGLTYGARGGFNAGKVTGRLIASTFTKNVTTADTVKAVLSVISSMQTEPPNTEELSDAQSSITGKFALALETPRQVAGKVFELKFYGLPQNYHSDYFKKINALTDSDIVEFARKQIDADKLTIVVVGDAAQVKSSLEDIAPVTIVKPQGEASAE